MFLEISFLVSFKMKYFSFVVLNLNLFTVLILIPYFLETKTKDIVLQSLLNCFTGILFIIFLSKFAREFQRCDILLAILSQFLADCSSCQVVLKCSAFS